MRLPQRQPLHGAMTNALDDQPARLCMEFDFFRQIGFVEERLGIRSRELPILTMRVFVGHCDDSVATPSRALQVPGSPRRRGHVTRT